MVSIKVEQLLGSSDMNDLFIRSLDDADLKLKIIQLVIDNSLWVDPRVYENIQVVFPKTKRRSGPQKRGDVDLEGNTIWNNEPAKWAFWNAIGLNYYGMKNSYICHIYEGSVTKPEHFTNLANMVAMPRAIQSLSEWGQVNDILKYRSYELYKYTGYEQKLPDMPIIYHDIKFRDGNLNTDQLDKIIKRLNETSSSKPNYLKRTLDGSSK